MPTAVAQETFLRSFLSFLRRLLSNLSRAATCSAAIPAAPSISTGAAYLWHDDAHEHATAHLGQCLQLRLPMAATELQHSAPTHCHYSHQQGPTNHLLIAWISPSYVSSPPCHLRRSHRHRLRPLRRLRHRRHHHRRHRRRRRRRRHRCRHRSPLVHAWLQQHLVGSTVWWSPVTTLTTLEVRAQ
jgi:hypothetical protein